ncbi:MAG: hypothetical protein HFJ52_07680 [Clostridia bacterium]|nr:hypothetical protein [Clostridia bacterium]
MSEEAITLLTEIRDTLKHQDESKMLRIADVAEILGVNRDKAGKLWDREDFPRYSMGA